MVVSIILTNWNTLKYLKECVSSIYFNTKLPYELIIIDNGSNEIGTREYIQSVTDKFIFNETNLGFSKGNNLGAELASGLYLVFMNSDVVVGTNWLEDMLETFNHYPNCGAVGTLGNPQSGLINGKNVYFHQYKGQYTKDIQVLDIMAFCLLMKREVFNSIKFNETFELGCFEDNLLCKELTKRGYTLWISAKADISHDKPSRSFEANKIDYFQILEKNRGIYDTQKS